MCGVWRLISHRMACRGRAGAVAIRVRRWKWRWSEEGLPDSARRWRWPGGARGDGVRTRRHADAAVGRRGVRVGSARRAAGPPQPRVPGSPGVPAEVGLSRRLPALLDEGATEMRFGDDLPPTMVNFEREPDDDDLSMLACRRTTFEWVVRRAALAEGRVEFRTGVAVDGLVADTGASARNASRSPACAWPTAPQRRCDLVVVAAGRRSALPEWLGEVGCAPVDDEVDDTGIVYFSRFYRLRDGAAYPPRTGPIGGDLGYLKYGVFVGDNRTFSVTLATPTDDQELRKDARRPGGVRLVRPPAGRHCAVARRPRRADHRTGPRDGRAAQPLARVRRRRATGRHRRSSPSATPCCAPTRSTAAAAHRVLGSAPDGRRDRRPPRRPRSDAAGLRGRAPRPRSTRGTAPASNRTPRPGASPPRCSPARIPTAIRTTSAASCAACSATGWCRRCVAIQSCCVPSSDRSTC